MGPLLFAIVMDELLRSIQREVPWYMLFEHDIVLIDETREGLNERIEMWREALETKGSRLASPKQSTWNVSLMTLEKIQRGK